MHTFSKKGFTLVEVIVFTLILGTLFTALYVGAVPYMQRSRDTKRVSAIFQYTSILEAYDKNFDTFPSNFGSGNSALRIGYCLSELVTRSDVVALGNEGKFSMFSGGGTSAVPTDPDPTRLVVGCPIPGSYLYSRLTYGSNNQLAILATSLEIKTSANYGTGSELTNSANYQKIIDAKKGSLVSSSPDQLFIVSKIK